MTAYGEWMKEAIRRAESWGLACPSTAMMGAILNRPTPAVRLGRDMDLWRHFENYSRNLSMPPEQRANACARVHPETAVELMGQGFPHLPCVTIGDVHWIGDSSFDVTEVSLKACLDAGPAPGERLAFHAWITFPDLTILDLTFGPWQCRHNKEPMNLAERGGLCHFGLPEDLSAKARIEHRPFLAGPELLWRTASASQFLQTRHRMAEQMWLRAWSPASGGKVGRNEPCPCGSGTKYKKCCLSGADS